MSNMLRTFGDSQSFRTYALEKNPSFSANCNVVKALLLTEGVDDYASQITKAVQFLCDTWDRGIVKDKWVCPIFLGAQSEFI